MDPTLSTLHAIAIALIPQLNNKLNLPIFEKCGGIDGFFEEKETTINTLLHEAGKHHISYNPKEWLTKAREEWELMQKNSIRYCTIEDSNYPHLLFHCEDAPLTLFYKGNLPNTTNTLAIVGTRKATERGKNRIDTLLKEMSGKGYDPTIVSGLAYGIDITAHKACLQYGLQTYAVLGHGLNMIYPAQHKNTAQKIIEQGGALISEFSCNMRILPVNFLQRNRIIAGICEATLIAESPVKGGAMATARQAFSYNREVMAIPGRPEDDNTAGCNLLIKQNIATLVENLEDIANTLHWQPAHPATPYQTTLPLFSDSEETSKIKAILSAEGEVNIDRLQLLSGIAIPQLSPLLLSMELEGIILQLPGKTYTLT